MTVDDKIKALRAELRHLKAEEERKLRELDTLFLKKAEEVCPISIGTKVEYEPGKFGQVDRIGYDVEFFRQHEDDAEIQWNVSGRKINKTGKLGKKDFRPVGPAYYFVKGTVFKHKGISGSLGITGPDDE
ncbi:hypothetical protein GN155_017560 [Alcanivorax sp. ZXX171]|jgi:hypothetical protein|nr:hypothetical protein [Alcanivorax sp. ZXX171]